MSLMRRYIVYICCDDNIRVCCYLCLLGDIWWTAQPNNNLLVIEPNPSTATNAGRVFVAICPRNWKVERSKWTEWMSRQFRKRNYRRPHSPKTPISWAKPQLGCCAFVRESMSRNQTDNVVFNDQKSIWQFIKSPLVDKLLDAKRARTRIRDTHDGNGGRAGKITCKMHRKTIKWTQLHWWNEGGKEESEGRSADPQVSQAHR